MNGWIKTWRSTLDHHVWKFPADQYKVWCALLMLASYKDTEWFDGNTRIPIPEGCLITSQESLAKLCGVGRQTIRTCIRKLTSLNSILTKQVTNQCTLITIVNWPLYQGNDNETNQETNQRLTNDQPTTNQPLTTSEEVKKVRRKEKNEEPPIVPHGGTNGFDKFWASYPKKQGKGAARKAWYRLHPSEALLQTILDAIDRQSRSEQWQREGGQFIPMPTTWLNQERWEDQAMSPKESMAERLWREAQEEKTHDG